VKVVSDKKYPTMYRIRWANGDLSVDFYNKVRAKEMLYREGIENYERGVTYNHPLWCPEKPVDAFK
jgi:hypothetical protein